MKPVMVKWQDAVSSDAWEETEEAKELEPHAITTIGWLVDENKQRIIVGLNWDQDRGAVSQTIAIPKSWILEQRILRVKI